jgi:hypothetical protein|tara:strand:- start:44 stop:775 length:732 start_codon:yes stop_codon:yes gene_type:complete
MSFPQTIMGKPGWEKQTSTSQKHKLGTPMQIGERTFRYVEAGEAIVAGNLTMGKAGTAAHQVDLAVEAASVGDTTITLSGSLTITEDLYKDGYLIFNDVGEEGHFYKVKGNTAVSSATGCVVTIDEEDGLVTAITTSQQVGLYENPYKDIEKHDGSDIDHAPLGWTCVDIASGSYGWICVSGFTAALIEGTPGAGLPLVASNSADGSVEILDSDDDAEGTIVAYMGPIAGVNGEYGLIKANLE